MRIASLSILAALTSLACSAADSTPRDAAPANAKAPDAKAPDAKAPDAKAPDAKAPDAKAPDAKTPDAKAPDPAIAEKRAKAKAKFTGTDDAELGKRRTQMLASLNEGRKLVKDGDVEGGIAKYEALLAIVPTYGPALGELGWAEFKAGKYDDANAHTARALAETDDSNKRGMLLYNLGRVAEARGHTAIAIGHYQTSLAARPNDIVADRLAKLQAAAPTQAPAEPPASVEGGLSGGLAVLGKDLPSLEAMCQAAGEDSACGSEADCELVGSPAGSTELGLVAMDEGMIRCWYPAIHTATGWMLFGNALFGQSGSEVDQDVDKLASRVESNDAGEFLIIEFSDHIYERIWADIEDEDAPMPDWLTTDREGMVICRIDGVPACTPVIGLHHSYQGEEGSADPTSYSATVSLRGDTIVVGDVEAKRITPKLSSDGWDEHLMLPAGEYSFAELAKR